MNAKILALITAISWGVGGFFEKKGLHDQGISPLLGITIRTLTAATIFLIFSQKEWKKIDLSNTNSLLYIALGGGLLAGVIGLLCFYKAISIESLGVVMPIAFTSPLFGTLMGIIFSKEEISLKSIIGMLLTIMGIILITYKKT